MPDPIAIKRAVFSLAKDALPDFTATWGFAARDIPRKWLYMGNIRWPESQWVTNRSRQYELAIPLVLNVIKVRTPAEDCEAYLVEQLNALEDAFNADSTLRDVGVISWALNPQELGSQPHTDGGIEAQAGIEVRVTYRP